MFDLASREDIREELDVMSEEWDFTLVRTFHDIYIVPLPDNEMFNMRFRDFRESIATKCQKGRGLFAMLYYHGYSLDVFWR